MIEQIPLILLFSEAIPLPSEDEASAGGATRKTGVDHETTDDD